MSEEGSVLKALHRSRGRFAVVGMVAALACGGALSACGGSDSSSSGGSTSSSTSSAGDSSGGAKVAEAKKRLTAAQAPAKWDAPGPAFDGSKARGKKIMYIGVASSIPIVQTIYKGLSDAAGKVGVTVQQFDGKGQVSEFNRGIATAISQKYDAIVLLAIPSALVKGALADAKKAGIPVVQAQERDPDGPLADGVVGQVSFCYSCAGKLMADFVVSDSGGDAQGAIFVSKDVTNGIDEERGIREELSELCPNCQFETQNVAVADWQTRLPTLTRSLLTSKPKTNYILPLYDSMTVPVIPAVVQAGKASQVKVASFNATPSVMEEMGRGNVISADVGGASVWFGWGLADQLFRVMTGGQPVADEKIPLRMFTRDNVGSIDLKKDESTWYGDADFRGEYGKLWGLGS